MERVEPTKWIISFLKKNVDLPHTAGQISRAANLEGYSFWDIRAALKELEWVPYIGSWWSTKDRTMYYAYYNMSQAEIQMFRDHDIWYDELQSTADADRVLTDSR